MILPQNILPLVRSEVAATPPAVGAIDAVNAALTTEDLTQLNKQVDVDNDDANQVAGDWLKSKGLGLTPSTQRDHSGMTAKELPCRRSVVSTPCARQTSF